MVNYILKYSVNAVFSKIYETDIMSEYNFFDKVKYHNDNFKKQILNYLSTKPCVLPFKFDGKFISKFYNINVNDIYTYYYYCGYRYIIPNSETLKTMFDDIILYERPTNIYVLYKNKYYAGTKFVDTYIKNPKDIFKQKISTNKHFDKTEYDLVILLFVGNNDIGKDMINKLYQNKSYQANNVLLAIVTLKNVIDVDFYTTISKCFKQYVIFELPCNFGSDITPSVLAYEVLCGMIKFKTILKLHTKTNNDWRNGLLVPFIENSSEYLQSLLTNDIGIVASKHVKVIQNINRGFNHLLLSDLYSNDVSAYDFAAGSMFLCSKIYFDKCMEKINEIMESLLYMQYYDVNYLFFTHSPAHTVERIFGITAIILNKKNLYI